MALIESVKKTDGGQDSRKACNFLQRSVLYMEAERRSSSTELWKILNQPY